MGYSEDRSRWLPTYYKARSIPSTGPCALCATSTRKEVKDIYLGYGVSSRLCEEHASEAFRLQRNGRDFLASMLATWTANGCMTKTRHKVLDLVEQQRKETIKRRHEEADSVRRLPGSYRCPEIRRAVEQAVAKGVTQIRQLDELVRTLLKAELRRGRIKPPSLRTLRRWRQERRWTRPGWQAPTLGTAANPT